MSRKAKKYFKQYALYKGEEFIDIGNAKELAERVGTTVNTILWYAGSNRYKSKEHKRGYVVVLLDEED